MSGLVVAVMAAGASSRMRGRDKLLETIEGVPLLRRVAVAALTLGAPVFVTLPVQAPARRAALDGLDVRDIAVPRAAEGMAASFRAVVAQAGAADGLMCVLGDMPEIEGADLAAVAADWDGSKVARGASDDGMPGQPVLFPRRLFPALSRVRGDTGGREVLRGEAVRLVPLPGRRAVLDLDTPEAWAAWRARTGISR